MLVIIVCIVVAVIFSIIAIFGREKTIGFIVFPILALTVMVCEALDIYIHKSNMKAEMARIEVEERYNILSMGIRENPENYLIMANDIIEYNAEVKKGQFRLQNAWTKDFEYEFWNEMPLIEINATN